MSYIKTYIIILINLVLLLTQVIFDEAIKLSCQLFSLISQRDSSDAVHWFRTNIFQHLQELSCNNNRNDY